MNSYTKYYTECKIFANLRKEKCQHIIVGTRSKNYAECLSGWTFSRPYSCFGIYREWVRPQVGADWITINESGHNFLLFPDWFCEVFGRNFSVFVESWVSRCFSSYFVCRFSVFQITLFLYFVKRLYRCPICYTTYYVPK